VEHQPQRPADLAYCYRRQGRFIARAGLYRCPPIAAVAPWGWRQNGSCLLLEHGASENRSASQGGVEAIER
jgi:hypothetical protein